MLKKSNFSNRDKEKDVEEKEKNNAARKALRQVVANLPTKPTEKLPIEYLRALPMVIGMGSLLILLVITLYVDPVTRIVSNSINNFSRKTNELLDYTSLSASIGVSSLTEQILSFRQSDQYFDGQNGQKRLLHLGRSRLKNRQKKEFETFSESIHLIANSASALYKIDDLKKVEKLNIENNKNKEEEIEEDIKPYTVYDLRTKKYSCVGTLDGWVITKEGRCVD